MIREMILYQITYFINYTYANIIPLYYICSYAHNIFMLNSHIYSHDTHYILAQLEKNKMLDLMCVILLSAKYQRLQLDEK